jgi:CHAT domain-containing protein/Tfp pilus assembly protein PilF
MTYRTVRDTTTLRLGLVTLHRKLTLLFNLLWLLALGVWLSAPSAWWSAPVAAAQGEQDVCPLGLGKPIEREVAGGQSHAYQVALAEGQYLNVVVEQRGIDLVVRLLGPDGKLITEFDSEIRNQGQETVSQVAEVAGSYQLNVQARQKGAPAGRYEIRVVELRAATEQDRVLQEARKLSAESVRLERAGKYNEALSLAERALEIREKALGPDHPEVGASLYRLAVLYKNKGDYAKAEPLYQRALTIQEKALGPGHPAVARSLNSFGSLYREKGDYARAELLYQRALAIWEKALGPDDPDVAAFLNNLAVLYDAKGDFAKAEQMYQRALAIKEKTLGPNHSNVASTLNNLAGVYFKRDDFAKAEPLYQRALAIWEKALGPEHPDVALSLNNLATFYQAKGDSAKAGPLLQRALAIWEKTLGPKHPHVATSLNRLAKLYYAKGDYAKAEPLYQRALAIKEKALGPEHPDVAASLDSLAGVYYAKGDYAKAEQMYQRALAINEKALGPEHSDVANSLNSLAVLYQAKGDYAKAGPMFQHALAILEKALGPGHSDVANSLNNLATIYAAKGNYAMAEPLFQRALAIWEKALGPDHPEVARFLNNLAGVYEAKGDYAKAEALYQRTLAILEKAVGPDHSYVALSFSNLAGVHKAKGDYTKAELLYRRALVIWEKSLGPESPQVATSLNHLSELYAARGDLAQAMTFQSRANAVSERNIALNLATGSEHQKLAYLATLSAQTDQTVSLHAHSAPDNPTTCRLATTTILQRKGRVLDAMSDSLGALRRRLNPQDQALLDQLKETNAHLARLVLGGPQRMPPAEHQKQIKTLEEEKEKYEAEISRRSAEFRAQSQPVTLAAVQAAIPPDAALIEFFSYRPFNAKYARPDEQFGRPRYVAYLLRRQGDVRWVELGERQAIDDAIDALRRALRSRSRRDVKRLARVVDRMVAQPLRPLLRPTRRVFLSPDGALNLIPFAALVDERDHYLVEHYEFSYLTSGRDLLRLQARRPSRQSAMIVADPDFGKPSDEGLATSRILKSQSGSQPSAAGGLNLAGVYFGPLPGTADEARALKAMMPDATVFTGKQATEAAIKQVSGPSILHVATHGFFLRDPEASPADSRGLGLSGSAATPESPGSLRVENPLLRSGLALAGANQRRSGEDDGILTALEAANLDLWGTKLVALSACDTGVGELKNGEGIYGLRRALALAGSESQLMSLWPVSDKGTRDLMIAYFKSLQQGQGRSKALRLAQLRMLRDERRRHPYYWASFIQSGEWANLEGER